MKIDKSLKKGTLEFAARNGLVNALKLQKGERITIITDTDTETIGTAFYKEAKNIGGSVNYFVMENFGKRPMHYLPQEIKEALESSDVTLYVADAMEGELKFRGPMIDAAENARHGHGVGITEEIMLTGMQTDIIESNRICREMYERIQGVQKVGVTTALGTDIELEFDPENKWINSDWTFAPGRWHNLPSGEIFSTPINANGIYIVDGVLGDHFDTKYGSLEKTPVEYTIEDNLITKVRVLYEGRDNRLAEKSAVLEQEITAYIKSEPDADMLGELGIGALIVDMLVYKMLQDEKMLGTVHIAHGFNYGDKTGAGNNRAKDTHCDGVILKPTVVLYKGQEPDILLKDGVYQPVN